MTSGPNHGRPLKALLIGGGGREHALAWRLSRSASLGGLWATHASNPGIAALARPLDFDFSMGELYRVTRFCETEGIDLVVVGPEGPLAGGIADELAGTGAAVFGPGREAARLEADKSFAKGLMRSASVPTAEYRVFRQAREAKAYLKSRDEPHVVKASGLAAGKGVFVPESLEAAFEAVDRIMVAREFGDAGAELIVEERLKGPEVSVFALVDGRSILTLDACQDHKRLGEGDTGPNTGGMGAFCPSRVADGATLARVEREILVPTLDALRREGIEYRGVLYAGLMLTHAGPKALEFNVRFGDPECQCLVRRIGGDFARVLHATATGSLGDLAEDDLAPEPGHACCVVLASEGYPFAPQTGVPIEGVEAAEALEGVTVFHAGTRRDEGGRLLTAGGRVLNVVATGATLEAARERAYEAANLVEFRGKTLRRDIAGASVGAGA